MAWWIAVVVGALAALLLDVVLRRNGAAGGRRGWSLGLLVAALIYVAFALPVGGSALRLEALGVLAYLPFAVLGWRGSSEALAVGWALHVAWDLALHGPATPFVPVLYLPLCLGFDLAVAGVLLRSRHSP